VGDVGGGGGGERSRGFELFLSGEGVKVLVLWEGKRERWRRGYAAWRRLSILDVDIVHT
jgi:hypothetical protein